MELVDLLGIIHAPIKRRNEVLREPHNSLDDHEEVRNYPQNCVGGLEVRDPILVFVHLDDDEAGYEGRDTDVVEGGVDVGSLFLLVGCVSWLEDEGALGNEEEAGGVEELSISFSMLGTC